MRSSGRLAGETGCRAHIRRVVTENGCGVRMRLSAAVAAGDKALLPALTSAPPRVCMMSPTQGASAHLSMKAPFNLGSSSSCVGNGCVSLYGDGPSAWQVLFFFSFMVDRKSAQSGTHEHKQESQVPGYKHHRVKEPHSQEKTYSPRARQPGSPVSRKRPAQQSLPAPAQVRNTSQIPHPWSVCGTEQRRLCQPSRTGTGQSRPCPDSVPPRDELSRPTQELVGSAAASHKDHYAAQTPTKGVQQR